MAAIVALACGSGALGGETKDLPHAFDAGWEGQTTCELLYETHEVRVRRCE